MKIASWNVNSVKARLPLLLDWLKAFSPDVVLLQELKCQSQAFPMLEVESAGYNVAVFGQKTYNGVAILSKTPLEDVTMGLPGDESDEQARYIEAVTNLGDGVLRVASIYLPNGNPVDTEKFPYKLAWMDRLTDHARNLLALEEPLVLGGDYNIIPDDRDAHNPEAWGDDALGRPESRQRFRTLVNLGLTDAIRAFCDAPGEYTYWDYQRGAWQHNHGLRIDHLLLSPQAADRLTASGVDRTPRGWERPSDHTPVWCEISED